MAATLSESSEPRINHAAAFLRRWAARWRGKGLQVLCLFFFFLSAGLFVFAKCPPVWRDYDGLIQISNRPSDLTLLLYPAAYPIFSRLHVWTAQIIEDRIHHTKTPAPISIRQPVTLNNAGIDALMLSQQIAMALAFTAFAWNCARSRFAQWGIAILIVSNASFFIVTNLISTEALAQILLVAIAALGFRLFATEKLARGDLAAYALCLYLSIMTRHTNTIFAMLLPMACLFRIAFLWIRERGTLAPLWKQTAIFIVAGFACMAAANLTTRVLCHKFRVPYRSVSARATSERLGFVNRMPTPEREAFLADLQTRAGDPVVKEAIPLLARHASWVQQRTEIETIILRESPSLDKKTLTVRSDACLDRVASLFFRSHNHYLVQETLEFIWRALASTSAATVANGYLERGELSIDLYAADPGLNEKTRLLDSCGIEAKNRMAAFARNPWLRLWSWAPHGVVLLGSSGAALLFMLRKIGSPLGPLFALASAFTGAFATCLALALVNYEPRFTWFADLFSFLSLAIVAAHGIDALCAGGKTSPTKETHRTPGCA